MRARNPPRILKSKSSFFGRKSKTSSARCHLFLIRFAWFIRFSKRAEMRVADSKWRDGKPQVIELNFLKLKSRRLLTDNFRVLRHEIVLTFSWDIYENETFPSSKKNQNWGEHQKKLVKFKNILLLSNFCVDSNCHGAQEQKKKIYKMKKKINLWRLCDIKRKSFSFFSQFSFLFRSFPSKWWQRWKMNFHKIHLMFAQRERG